MKKRTDILTVLIDLHLRLSSVGAFIDFEALCNIWSNSADIFYIDFLAEATPWLR